MKPNLMISYSALREDYRIAIYPAGDAKKIIINNPTPASLRRLESISYQYITHIVFINYFGVTISIEHKEIES